MKEQPPKEERKRLLIEMLNDKSDELDRESKSHQVTNTEQLLVNTDATNSMKEDEKNGMYEVPNFVEPILLKAGDKCVKINGQHPYVDCRIISEDNYQLLLSTIQKLNKFKIQAYELQSASQFKPSGVKIFTVEDMRAAYNAGMFEESGRFTVGQRQPLTFDEWIKIRE